MMPLFNHTPHTNKQIVEPIVASHATNIVFKANYRSVEPQNGLTPHEHIVQGLHAALGVALLPIYPHL
jgi:hypothetical protein